MNKSISKYGFTIVEAMIILLIMSVTLAAMIPLVTKKHSNPSLKVPHGKYVCYRDSSVNLMQALYKNKTLVYNQSAGGQCTFTPPPKAAYFFIHAIGGGGGGGGAGPRATTRGSTNSNENISVSNPDLPSWLSETEYYDHSGSITLSVSSVCGGDGGDISYYTPGPPVEQVTYSGGSGSCSSKSCSVKIEKASMSFISNSPQHGCDGISDDVTSEITPTNGTPGLGGSISVSYDGMLKMTCTSTNPAGGSAATMGGNGSNGVVTSQSTHCGSGSTSHTPATLTAYTQYDTKTWKYGKGGNPGDFQSLFITSLKQAIPIILGEGGAAGDNSTGSSGDTGTATKFGNLLSATGGIGGQGNLSFGPYQVGTLPAGLTNVGGSYVKYGDDGFSSSTIFSFEAITGIFAASGLGSIGNYGRGGNGGGTVSTCNSSNLKHYFNGSLISQISSTCSDGSYIVDYYTDSKQAGTPSTPQKGFSGALIVIW